VPDLLAIKPVKEKKSIEAIKSALKIYPCAVVLQEK